MNRKIPHFVTSTLSVIISLFILSVLFSSQALAVSNGKIAFSSAIDDSFNRYLYVMNPDGSDQTLIYSTINAYPDASWSPDGTKIAVEGWDTTTNNTQIFVMNPDGTGITRLTSYSSYGAQDPEWSPDGTKITYISAYETHRNDIYVMNSDGSNQTRLTNWSINAGLQNPEWSPDGTKIAFLGSASNFIYELYIMNSDGTGITQITNSSHDSVGSLSWSPDGTKIAIDNNSQIYLINPDGTGMTQLTNVNQGANSNPDWSPDNMKIVFNSNRNGNIQIFSMNADGSNQTNLSNSNNNVRRDVLPSWQRITNLPPVISTLTNATINEGATYATNGSFTDPDSSNWTATVNYGDESTSQPLILSGQNFALNHEYKNPGIYSVTISVTDNQGLTGTSTAIITVNNVIPTIGTISATPNPLTINTETTTIANFTDPGVLENHTATWNWGDGITTNGTVTESNGAGIVNGIHTYTSVGVYTVRLTVTDNYGGSSTQAFQYISVYDPTHTGLFVAGAIFTSPENAYTQNPSVTGQVHFGIATKYDSNNQPAGIVRINFHAANLSFNATAISSLVITNNMAILTGTGTINGSGTYNFFATGINTGAIRIQITDPANNNGVIYDTQPGASMIATPIIPVTGMVLVHS